MGDPMVKSIITTTTTKAIMSPLSSDIKIKPDSIIHLKICGIL